MKLQELVEKIGGVLDGDGSVEICGVNGISEASSKEISFIANPKYAPAAAVTGAGAVIVAEDWSAECSAPVIRTQDPDAAFAQAAMMFYVPVPAPAVGVHPTAVVADDVKLGSGVSIGPQCVIESGSIIGANTVISAQCYIGHRVLVGEDTRIYPQVSVREASIIGDRSIIHSGTVVGSDGFGYSVDEKGVRTKIDQIGIVQIGDDVEIGANVTIDRARFGKTLIGNGTKIDNLVQIAHNVTIGENSVVISQVGLAGSCSLGDRVIIAGQSGVAGHVKIGSDSVIAGKTGVTKDVEPGSYMMGMPAMPATKFKRVALAPVLIPKMRKRITELEAKVKKLEGQGL
ncbi:MAG: UDP-3-O-(3-hydroxymyristoyl)glucosamine N-acyltransferase [Kiritimatiellaceae bacterium]|nr:UDP-3-O-(3-hydroxymyristoyl)glucosamine N-acyltransferase [Kiritimatiellaceae bacterium]